MNTARHQDDRARGGFTLLELLVVIAIIVALASVTVAGFAAMARGRALGQSASTVRTAIMQASSYANRYNVRTRVLTATATVGDQTRHYMLVEWYNSLDEPAGTDPNVYPDIAWYPLGTDQAARTDRLARANREYLSGSVRFFPAGNPISELTRDTNGIVRLPTTGLTDQIHLVPSGGIGPWEQAGNTYGSNNLQVGLTSLGEQDVERKAVLVLRASGLTYIEDAYGEGDY